MISATEGDAQKVGQTTQACEQVETKPAEGEKPRVRVSLFFDGTLNNKTNVSLGSAYSDDDSYHNDYSNIAHLEGLWRPTEEYDLSFKLYVEGIGTTDKGEDSTLSAATGMYGSGVKAKVESGIDRLLAELEKLEEDYREFECLHLDAFGFSRGAAAARHFVHKVLNESWFSSNLQERLAASGYEVDEVQVKFVGLYDTVASYGANHGNDTDELALDAIRDAEYVVHLAAAEEHRKHFRLTDISSALAQGKGLEIFLPGVHSDVGGGYTDEYDEEGLQIIDIDRLGPLSDAEQRCIEREKNWLLQAGWCVLDENSEDKLETNYWNELRLTRRGISNRYSRIPLRLMAGFAETHGLAFKRGSIKKKFRIPSELRAAKEAIDRYIAGLGVSAPEDWMQLNTPVMQKLRNRYLHLSAHYGSTAGANTPQFSGDEPLTGWRERIIQSG